MIGLKSLYSRIAAGGDLNPRRLLLENRGHKQVILKNTFWLTLAQGLTGGVNFFLAVYVIRTFGATEYGKFAFAFSFASLFSVFFDFGISTVATREFAKDRDNERHLSDILTLKMLSGIVIVAFIMITALFITTDVMIRKIILALGIYVLALEALNIFYVFFRARQRMEAEAAFRFLQVFILCGAVVGVIAIRPTILNLSLAYVGAAVVVLVIVSVFFALKESLGVLLRPSFNIPVWKTFLAIGFYLALAKGVGDITTYTDSVLLGYWGMLEETGWYNAMLKLNKLVLFPMSFVTTAFFPALVSMLRESEEKFVRYWSFWMKGTVFFSILLFFVVLAKADRIIELTYSSDFLPAVPALKILVLMATMIYILNLYYQVLLIFDQQKRIFYAVLCGTLMNVVLNLVLIPLYGITGAALATVTSHIAILCLFLFFTPRHTIIKPLSSGFFLAFSTAVASGALMYAGLSLVDFVANMNLLFSLVGGIILYTVSFVCFDRVLSGLGYLGAEKI